MKSYNSLIMHIHFIFNRPVKPVSRPVYRSNRGDDNPSSFAKPISRPAPAKSKVPPGGKKVSAAGKPGAGAKARVDAGRGRQKEAKQQVCIISDTKILMTKYPSYVRKSPLAIS